MTRAGASLSSRTVRGLLMLTACCGVAFDARSAEAQEPPVTERTATGDAVSGWTLVDRQAHRGYLRFLASGGQTGGGVDRCEYVLKLGADGSLTGEATGRLRLVGDAAVIPVGRPSLAMSSLTIDGQPALWGADPQGVVCLFCPSGEATFRFECSQQGIRRGESLEFNFDWLTSVATRLRLAVPDEVQVETTGLLRTADVAGDDGGRILSFEAGARPGSTVRILPQRRQARQPFGMELKQTVSATATKVLIQSIVEVVCQSAGPELAEIEVPAGFRVRRVTLGGNDRLPVGGVDRREGLLRVPLGDVTTGQRVELRLVLESPADWSEPLLTPRVAPRNGVLLHEDWILQIEKPLELISVDAPEFVQTSLAVESGREVWTYQGTSPQGTLTLTARTPRPEWFAECFVRRQSRGPRVETQTLIELRSARSPLFEFELDLAQPWRLVSVTGLDAAGAVTPLSYTQLEPRDGNQRVQVMLRTPASPQRNAQVTITAAAQAEPGSVPGSGPVAVPQGGVVDTYFVLPATAAGGAVDPGVDDSQTLRGLRTSVRSNPFFDGADLDRTVIRKITRRGELPGLPVTAAASTAPAVGGPSAAASAIPLAQGTAVLELSSALGSASGTSTHHAVFVFDQPVDVSDAVIGLDGEWSIIDLECDGVPVHGLSLPGELRLPQHAAGVRELQIRYSTPGAQESFPRRDRVIWPQLSARVQRWIWRVEAPGDRRLTGIDAPADYREGIARPALRERLLAPLGRPAGTSVFHPLRIASWKDALGLTGSPASAAIPPNPRLQATGRDYPRSTTIESWSTVWLEWLNWVLLAGSLLAVAVLRRFRRGTFRFASVVSAVAATGAWLLPAPLGSMAGAVFCGSMLGFVVPRRLLAPATRRPAAMRGSTLLRVAGASALLLACFTTPAVQALQDAAGPVAADEAGLSADEDHSPVPVPETLARDIAQWQRDQAGPAHLIRGARYDVQVDSSDLATVTLEFDVVVPRPDLTRSIQFPFEGLTFRGPDAARINGGTVRLVPTADGTGVILALPPAADGESTSPTAFRVELAAALRVPAAGRREFALSMPRCPAAIGVVRTGSAAMEGFRSTARGSSRMSGDRVECALGAVARWQARWRTTEVAGRSTGDVPVTARAESVVSAEPEALRMMTRLILETPELPDPFAPLRLEVLLPKEAIVTGASGETVSQWKLRPEPDGIWVLLDLSSAPFVGQQFDLQYDLPLTAGLPPEIPAISLLDSQRLSNHQVAVVTLPSFDSQILSPPDPDSGLWAVAPSEASFSLRRDRGFPVPASALELERPTPLALQLQPRPTGRNAELEQTFTATGNTISWLGAARIETSLRPGFLYEFRIDPAIEIRSASVTERNVERLSRFLRENDRLLLVVGDDRLGTKNVRLEGTLKLEAGKVRPVPLFDLQSAVITRRELVVTSSVDQMLQVRRDDTSPLLVGGHEPEWEPATPSSRRFAISAGGGALVMRWINPASPLNLVEFLSLPESSEADCDVEWRLESNVQLPAALVLDAPDGTRIEPASDFMEESRRNVSGQRVQIGLQSGSNRIGESRLRMTVPLATADAGAAVLPRLADLPVQPITYLAVPRSLLGEFAFPGDFLDQLPDGAPPEWRVPFADRRLLIFQLSGNDWSVGRTGTRGDLGKATLETVAVESAGQLAGETRWIVSPAQVGLLAIEPPQGGVLNAVECSPGTFLEPRNGGGWQILVRPSQPVAVYAAWSAPAATSARSQLSVHGPLLSGVELNVTFSAVLPATSAAEWAPEFLARPVDADRLAAVRIENLLSAARQLPIGVRPPRWLRDELLDLSRAYRESPMAGRLSVQVESVLDSWSARMSTLTAPHSIAPQATLLTRDSQRVLADGMLIAASDPELTIEVPRAGTRWAMPQRVFNALFVSAWLIFWAFVITKGGQWAHRVELADQVARRPAIVTLVIGLAWWLLLSPGVYGMLLAAAALAWSAGLRLRGGVGRQSESGVTPL